MKFVAFVLAAAAAFLPVAVHAQMVKAQEPQSVVSAMQSAGYAAKMDKNDMGNPMIESGASGSTFHVHFSYCEEKKNCRAVQFRSAYDYKDKIPLQKINDWNKKNFFGRAYLDDVNDPILEMDVNLDEGGISSKLFADHLKVWATILASFEKHIGFRE